MRGPINQESITTDESVEAKLVSDKKKNSKDSKCRKQTNSLKQCETTKTMHQKESFYLKGRKDIYPLANQ
jgi:hypothetical protein